MSYGYEYTFCLGNIGIGEPQWRFVEFHLDDDSAVQRATKVAGQSRVIGEGNKVIVYRKNGTQWINVAEVLVDRALQVNVNVNNPIEA